jgi:hypothetical protein
LIDVRSRAALEVAEQFADGIATLEQLNGAFNAAWRPFDPTIAVAWSVRIAAYAAALAAFDDYQEPITAAPFEASDAVAQLVGDVPDTHVDVDDHRQANERMEVQRVIHCSFLRDIFGNPFRPVTLDPASRTANVVGLAQSIYDERAFDRLPILADALEDAGCTNADILNHCRQPGEHVRGCWCVDLALGKQ